VRYVSARVFRFPARLRGGDDPALTLIVASRLRHGRRAGMLNAAGIQLGLAFTAGMVLLGLASLIAAMGAWFVQVRLAGAAARSSCRVYQHSIFTEVPAARATAH
jgi:hypothetical protein